MKTRYYGIDFLRIFCMFMIVILHLLGFGGILDNTIPFSASYWSAWFLEIFCYCAVNCFALISGYVMLNSHIQLSKLLELWIQVAFYSIFITAIVFVFSPDTIAFSNIINSILPVTRNQYWYISSYFGMSILVPLLNLAIKHIDKKTFAKILAACFFFGCVLSPISKDPYLLNAGYSTAWLSILYLTGAFIKKYDIIHKCRKRTASILFFSSIMITFLSKMILEYAFRHLSLQELSGNVFVSYTSPTIIISAISLFIFCLKLKFNTTGTKMISLFAPTALSVYLIHTHPLIVSNVLKNFLIGLIGDNFVMLITKILILAFLIWFICSVIDLLRIKLFKLLKIKEFCCYINHFFTSYNPQWISKF